MKKSKTYRKSEIENITTINYQNQNMSIKDRKLIRNIQKTIQNFHRYSPITNAIFHLIRDKKAYSIVLSTSYNLDMRTSEYSEEYDNIIYIARTQIEIEDNKKSRYVYVCF